MRLEEWRDAFEGMKEARDRWAEWAWDNGYDPPDNPYEMNEKIRTIRDTRTGKWYKLTHVEFGMWKERREMASDHPELILEADQYAWMRAVAIGGVTA